MGTRVHINNRISTLHHKTHWDKSFKNINVTDHANGNVFIKAQDPNKVLIQETLMLSYLPVMLCLYLVSCWVFFNLPFDAFYKPTPPPKKAFYIC